MSPPFEIRRMQPADVAAVEAITKQCSEAAQWTAADYAPFAPADPSTASDGRVGLVAVAGADVAAFLVARVVADELEILNLGVAPAQRRRGAGSVLMQAALDAAALAAAAAAFCEVRESNAAGRAFYAGHGFKVEGRRLRYYSNPVEDALVLARKL